MEVSVEKTGDLERRLTVQVPATDIESQVSSRLSKLRGELRLKGFRPGKVPMRVVQQRYGRQVREEIQQQVIQSSLREAIEGQSLRVAGVTRIEPRAEEQEGAAAENFEFVADMEVFPELEALELGDLEVERPQAEITDADVDNMIETLREQRRQWKAAGRAAAEGDRIRVEYSAVVDGRPVPDSGVFSLAHVLGSGALFDDFDKALTGLAEGEEGTGTLTFPESYREAALAGKTGEVSFKVTAVESSELPEVDEAFMESFGVEGGIDKFRDDVRNNLERELRQAVSSKLKLAVTDALKARFDSLVLPASMVRQEAEQLQTQYREQSNGGEPPPLEQFTDSAEQRVKIGFLLSEIARQNGISIDESRVQAQIADIADTYEHPAEVIALYRDNPQLSEGIRNLVLEEQVVEHVLSAAKVTDTPISFKELMGQT